MFSCNQHAAHCLGSGKNAATWLKAAAPDVRPLIPHLSCIFLTLYLGPRQPPEVRLQLLLGPGQHIPLKDRQ